MKDNSTKNLNNSDEILDIDLKAIFSIANRNKKFILSIVSGSLFLMGIKVTTAKDIWEGSFDILLSKTSSQSNINFNSDLKMRGGSLQSLIGSQDLTLNTQVEILKSPSVLMPIFNYVKDKKVEQNTNFKSWQYKSWLKQHLKIKLEEGTEVLKLKYKDTDKNLIIPVLELISAEFKKYSNKTKNRELSAKISYLNDQIKIYEDKKRDSMQTLEEFAYKHDIVIPSGQLNNSLLATGETSASASEGSLISSPVSIELLRSQAANRIKSIDELKKQVLSVDEKSDEFIYILLSIKDFNTDIVENLTKIDTNIARLEIVFNENDDVIKYLNQQKNKLRALSKENIINYLNAAKKNQLAIQESYKRPTSVLLKYKELLFEAISDEETLINLKNRKTFVSLQNSEIADPWRLITSPTLLPKPIGPSRKIFMIYSLIGSTILAFLLSLLKEQKSGLVFTSTQMEKILKIKILGNVLTKDNEIIKTSIRLISENLKTNYMNQDLVIIKLGEVQDEISEIIFKEFLKLLPGYKLDIKNNLYETSSFKNKIILSTLGKVKKDEVILFKNNLSLQNGEIIGLLLLEENEK